MLIAERIQHRLRFLLMLLIVAALAAHYLLSPWGYYWKVDSAEQVLRDSVVNQAEMFLGINEADGSHLQIVNLYNSQDILPMGYSLSSEDSWCAAFVTATAMEQNLTDILPPECSCGRQIELLQSTGQWIEKDSLIPLPGDLIYYDWDASVFGDNLGWPDHVGIVVGTKWPFIKVIEGNKDDSVSYRYIFINDMHIRGFGKPDYSRKNIP